MKHLKKLLISLILISCETGELTPLEKNFDGSWKLTKIFFGFPPSNGPRETSNVKNEIIKFDSQARTYSIMIDSKLSESGMFEIQEKDALREVPEDQIVYVEQKLYSPYKMSTDGKTLSLYQKAPIGARLADGSTYVYTKL